MLVKASLSAVMFPGAKGTAGAAACGNPEFAGIPVTGVDLPAGLSIGSPGLRPAPWLGVLAQEEGVEGEAHRGGDQQPRSTGWQSRCPKVACPGQTSKCREPDHDGGGQKNQGCQGEGREACGQGEQP